MKETRRILLATDLAPETDRAMERAVRLADQFKAELAALHVIPAAAVDDLGQPAAIISPFEGEREIMRHLQASAGFERINASAACMRGEVAQTVAEYAALWKADLLVAGARRKESMLDIFSISTVEAISVASPAPLLVVRNKPFSAYADLLVPVDFGRTSRPSLQAALAFAPHGEIRLLHACDLGPGQTANGMEMNMDDFARDFAALLDGLKTDGRMIDKSVRQGLPSLVIIEAARAELPDLVVMGTEGRTGIGRALLGSTAHQVLERLPSDVLLVRSVD